MEPNTTTDETSETASYELSLKGEGVTIERKVTRDVALAVINVALGGGVGMLGRGAPPGGGTAGRAGSGLDDAGELDERVTPGEFIERVNARTNPEKVTALGEYLRQMAGQENFARDDIRAMFRAAHEPAPANFGRDFRNALASNWIAEDTASDHYFVTRTGRDAVADSFEAARRRKPRRKTARTSSASSGGDED